MGFIPIKSMDSKGYAQTQRDPDFWRWRLAMDVWGAKMQRTVLRELCGVVLLGWGLSAGAAPLSSLPSAPVTEASDAADLADASVDSPVLRTLSAAAQRNAAGTAPSSDPRAAPASKPAVPASGRATEPPLSTREALHLSAKELAVSAGVVDAKQHLSAELGLDPPTQDVADPNVLRRRAMGGEGDEDGGIGQMPPLSAEQLKLDGERASFLASALVQEVMPWAIGAAVLLVGIKGLRLFLAFSRKQTERKRKTQRASSRSRPHSARF
jgi:hypothetical protein